MADLLLAIGGRGDAVRAAPVAAVARRAGLEVGLVCAPWREDDLPPAAALDELELPQPLVELLPGARERDADGVGRGIAAAGALRAARPASVLVCGSGPALLGVALAASAERIPVATLDAGLRTPGSTAAAESHRRVLDHVADVLFAPTPVAAASLRREGVPAARIVESGSTIPDAIALVDPQADADPIALDGEYALVYLRADETIEEAETLARTLEAVLLLGRCLPVVFPVHPRTRRQLFRFGLNAALAAEPGVLDVEPLGHAGFLALVRGAGVVLTDAGTVQDEATALGARCLTLARATDRQAGLLTGANAVVGLDRARIVESALSVLEEPTPTLPLPERWDGRAAERVVDRLLAESPLAPRPAAGRA
ncbi:MAG: UDP-N-acetylglucosamine 2-epimerase [Thermoleophilia bacterium]